MSTTTAPRTQQISDAARLVRYACQPRRKPLGDADYHDLVERYRSSPAFRELVDAIAEGMSLNVITAHAEEGLRVSAVAGGCSPSSSPTCRPRCATPKTGWSTG